MGDWKCSRALLRRAGGNAGLFEAKGALLGVRSVRSEYDKDSLDVHSSKFRHSVTQFEAESAVSQDAYTST